MRLTFDWLMLSVLSSFSDCSEEHDKTKNIQTEIDATKKEAQKEMERNETLEQLKQRIIESVNRLDKQRECST